MLLKYGTGVCAYGFNLNNMEGKKTKKQKTVSVAQKDWKVHGHLPKNSAKTKCSMSKI